MRGEIRNHSLRFYAITFFLDPGSRPPWANLAGILTNYDTISWEKGLGMPFIPVQSTGHSGNLLE